VFESERSYKFVTPSCGPAGNNRNTLYSIDKDAVVSMQDSVLVNVVRLPEPGAYQLLVTALETSAGVDFLVVEGAEGEWKLPN
jgi:hypothetical protein